MNMSRFSVERPVFTIMVVLIVIILGGVSLARLPIDLMPDITNPTLSVSTDYENAGPEEVEELITRPIEEALSAVTGVKEISSVSSEGSSNVRVTFNWGVDLDSAANDIRDRLDRVIPRLPDEADRPRLRKFDMASFPVLILGASSQLDPVQTRRIIDDQIKYRIERVAGVASLDIWGGLDREIHVRVNPDKINALQLSLDQILDRIEAGNVNIPAGSIERGNYEVTLRTPGEYVDLDELRRAVVAERAGAFITLGEIAEVKDSWQKVTRIVRVNGEPGVRLAVNKQSGTNTVEVANGVLDEIRSLARDIPQIKIVPIIDSSEYIKRSISNVSQSALYGGALAIMVLLLFLRNVRSTLVIATAIPVSIVAAFGLMYFAGFTLNLMTLGGLALGVGMLVDNSIVVLENIYRLREQGLGRLEAAIKGSSEVAAPVLASTLTTLVVFLPMVFVRGMAGVLFKQFALVIVFALLCSLFTALTLVPMLAGRLLHTESLEEVAHESLAHRVFRVTGLFLQRLENEYKALLHVALNHRLLTVAVAGVILGACLLLVPFVGTELMPESDEGEIRVNAEMEVGTRLELIGERLKVVEKIARESVPEIQTMVANCGRSHWHGNNATGELRISLKPQAERERSSDEIAAVLRKKLSSIPGMLVRVRTSQGFIGRMMQRSMGGGGDKIQVEIRGHDLHTADELGKRVREVVEEIPGVTDAKVSRDSGAPEEMVVVDRVKAADMKLTVREIAQMLQTVLSGTGASNFRESGDEYRILVQIKDAEKLDLREILDLTITNSDGEPVALRNVISVRPRLGPMSVERKSQDRVLTVSANLSGRAMGPVVEDIRRELHEVPVPRGFSILFGGEYEEQQKAFAELMIGFALALILVYMVMACQYESLRDPFVVMFSVPVAAVGVILMLFLTDTTFNIQSYIGCIMLGGIVVNNAILLVDTVNLLRRRDGLPLREAIEEAGRRRLRPILMTAMTTSLALVPLALGFGEGGEAQAPMARTVIGGLVSSTCITLLLTPVIYSLVERFQRKPADVPAENGR